MKRAIVVVLILCCAVGPLSAAEESSPETLLLKDFHPRSIYKIPQTEVTKARYPAIDMHAHVYAKTPEQVDRWVRVMDEHGIARVIVLTMATGKEFDNLMTLYSKYPDRFELWCGFDYTGYDKPGFGPAAVPAAWANWATRAKGCSIAGPPRRGACTSTTRAWTGCWRNAPN